MENTKGRGGKSDSEAHAEEGIGAANMKSACSDESSGQQEAVRDVKGKVIGRVMRTRGLGGKRKAGIEEVGGE